VARPDQRVDDRGPYVLIELIQDGAHGCPQLWRAHGFQRSVDLGIFRRHATSPVAKTCHSALRAYALRKRRRVAVAERAWRAFATRNPATVLHSPRSTDFTSVRSPASNTRSCASRLRCLRRVAVVDSGRLTRGISSVSIAHAQHGVGSSSITR